MTSTEQAILRQIAKREAALEARPHPGWAREDYRERFEFETQLKHGPRWSAAEWFDVQTEAERQRVVRALRRLEDAGLVQCHGARVTHVKLTDAGRAAITSRATK